MRGAKANSEINRLIILVNALFLLSPVTGSAYADDRCSETAQIVRAIHGKVDQAIALNRAEPEDPALSEAVVQGQRDPKNLTLACVLLEQRRSNAERKGNPWAPFRDEHINSDRELFDACYLVPECRNENEIQLLLERVCTPQKNGSAGGGDSMDPKACAAIKPPTVETARPELSKVRKGVGWGLIIGGGAAVILGTVQLFVPLGSQDTGCASHGLDLPCAPERFGLGFGLLAGGVAAGVGGILTLKL